MGAPPSVRASFADVVREGCGEDEGDAELRRAKRAARSSDGFDELDGGFDGVIEALNESLKLTLDFLSAFRRARRASSVELGSAIAPCCVGYFLP